MYMTFREVFGPGQEVDESGFIEGILPGGTVHFSISVKRDEIVFGISEDFIIEVVVFLDCRRRDHIVVLLAGKGHGCQRQCCREDQGCSI